MVRVLIETSKGKMLLFLIPPPTAQQLAPSTQARFILKQLLSSSLLIFLLSVVTPLVLPIKAARGLPHAVPAIPQSRGSGGVPAAGGSRVLQPPAVHRAAGGLLSAGSAGVGGPLLPAGGAARTSNAAQSW